MPGLICCYISRLTRYLNSPEDLRVSADDSDVLKYSRVSCNLMNDPEIQHAMFKSASAENLPKADPHLKVMYCNHENTLIHKILPMQILKIWG